jgi:hypothetical protein
MSTVKTDSVIGSFLPIPVIEHATDFEVYTATAGQTVFTTTKFDRSNAIRAISKSSGGAFSEVTASWTGANTVTISGTILGAGQIFYIFKVGTHATKVRVQDATGAWVDLSSFVATMSAASSNTLIVYEYTATDNQTVFSGADNNGLTLNYVAGSALVAYNEGLLQKTVDYTATSSSVLTLATGAEAGALVRIYAFGTFAVANVYTKAEDDAKFVAKTNILGTVSQSGGVPTGAIIEYTTDGAGSTCTRYADGTQVCTYRFRSPSVYALDVAVGAMWRTRDTAILVNGVNYLKAFVGELPKLSYTVRMDSWYGFPGLIAGTRTLTAWVPSHVISLASMSTTVEIDCIAWGRWF